VDFAVGKPDNAETSFRSCSLTWGRCWR